MITMAYHHQVIGSVLQDVILNQIYQRAWIFKDFTLKPFTNNIITDLNSASEKKKCNYKLIARILAQFALIQWGKK